jgi:hypothetical protein
MTLFARKAARVIHSIGDDRIQFGEAPGETTVPMMTQAVAAASAGAPPDGAERRRPGRRKIVSPGLIPLLRGQSGGWGGGGRQTPSGRGIDHDLFERPGIGPLAFRGIGIAIVFAIPLWVALGLVVDWIISAH